MGPAYDVLVVGSGAGGLAAAITARKHGLSVLMIEKEAMFDGTTAFSGGVLWIPGNSHGSRNHPDDTSAAARAYLRAERGNFYQPDAVEAFLRDGPRMLDRFERETAVRFVPTLYPDYHPEVEGGAEVGRRRPWGSSTGARRRVWTKRSGAVKQASTAISPTPSTSPTLASRRWKPGRSARFAWEIGDLGTFDRLKITVPGEVLDRSGTVLPGLYAVGNDRSSIMGGTHPGAGITLGPAMTFGRITGRHLAGIGETEDA